VDSITDTADEQANGAAYRSAVEALTAVVYEMKQQSAGAVSAERNSHVEIKNVGPSQRRCILVHNILIRSAPMKMAVLE
jgi:hypothetical protein